MKRNLMSYYVRLIRVCLWQPSGPECGRSGVQFPAMHNEGEKKNGTSFLTWHLALLWQNIGCFTLQTLTNLKALAALSVSACLSSFASYMALSVPKRMFNPQYRNIKPTSLWSPAKAQRKTCGEGFVWDESAKMLRGFEYSQPGIYVVLQQAKEKTMMRALEFCASRM